MSPGPLPPERFAPTPVEHVRRSVLPSGVRLVTDAQPGRSTAAVAVWVAVGSRDEPEPLAGVSHFLEHLLFKGTAERDARDIALALDGVGGEMNAYTAAEHTAFWVRVPAAALEIGLEVLLDVVERPLLAAEAVESERQVILEELAAAEEDPDDVVAVSLFESLFPGHPLGRETLGGPTSIPAISRDDIAGFFSRWYRPANLVVAAAGAIDHDQLHDRLAGHFGGGGPGEAPERSGPGAEVVTRVAQRRSVDQMHLALGWRAPSVHDEDRHAAALLNHLFGAGPSSLLFQEVRERRGLTYAIGSELSLHTDAGALCVYTATAPSKAAEVLTITRDIAGELAEHGVATDDLRRAAAALRGSLVMGLESAAARMSRLGVGETVLGGTLAVGEYLQRLDAVGVEDIRRVAQRVFAGGSSLSVVGPRRGALPS